MSSPDLAAAAQQQVGGGSESNKAKYTGQNLIYTGKIMCGDLNGKEAYHLKPTVAESSEALQC